MREIRDMEAFAKSQNAIEEIYAERRRQVDAEGWTPEHDDGHGGGWLGRAAAAYALQGVGDLAGYEGEWPVAHGPPPPPKDDRRRALVIAGALIVAEIERLDRLSAGGSEAR
jgi:hypothetical protein